MEDVTYDGLRKRAYMRAAEQRPYVSQWWVMNEECRPTLQIVAGPFNEERDACWAMGNSPGFRVVETRHPIYQPGEE